MDHPNLSDAINKNIAASEIEGGCKLSTLRIGGVLKVQTKNTLYIIKKLGEKKYTIQGNAKFCPTETNCVIHGSTWGGSMLKMGFVGRGMHMEFSVEGIQGVITTSDISEVTEEE